LEGWRIPAVEPGPGFQEVLERRAGAEGVDSLYRELKEIDPGCGGGEQPNTQEENPGAGDIS